MLRLSLVSVEIQSSENLGALARLCSNFEVEKLILVRPQCRVHDKRAYYTATDSRSVLDSVIRLDDLNGAYDHVDYLLALTGRPARDSLVRNVISIYHAVDMISKMPVHVGIVLGPENSGLSNDDLRVCDLSATIPLSAERRTHRVLNISHAAALVLHEFRRAMFMGQEIKNGQRPMSQEERALLRGYIDEIAADAYVPPHTVRDAADVLDSVLSRAAVNKKEIGLILTLFRGIQQRMSLLENE